MGMMPGRHSIAEVPSPKNTLGVPICGFLPVIHDCQDRQRDRPASHGAEYPTGMTASRPGRQDIIDEQNIFSFRQFSPSPNPEWIRSSPPPPIAVADLGRAMPLPKNSTHGEFRLHRDLPCQKSGVVDASCAHSHQRHRNRNHDIRSVVTVFDGFHARTPKQTTKMSSHTRPTSELDLTYPRRQRLAIGTKSHHVRNFRRATRSTVCSMIDGLAAARSTVIAPLICRPA